MTHPFLPQGRGDAVKRLDWAWNVYAMKPTWERSQMTHQKGTPWSDAIDEMRKKHPDKDLALIDM